jgi:DNA replication protein DnaC
MQRLENGEISALEAMDDLPNEEYSSREGRRVGVALNTAKLTPVKALESFAPSFQLSLNRNRIMALDQLEFINRSEVVHYLGPPGTGKSHLATALGMATLKVGKSFYRATLAEWIDALVRTEREERPADKIRFYSRAALLIVDEVGYLPITAGGANLFFQLVNARLEKVP